MPTPSSIAPIRLLPAELANQIAAGEVVERPASVVKELLENAIDAGAKNIVIELEEAGIGLIRLRDDGVGIVKEELTLAVKRHATSKIASFSDLMRLNTLGFRGEALASIAAVSKLKLTSCTKDAPCAYEVQVHGPLQEASVAPTAHPVGTSIEVRDLFYNTPVRRKFLKGLRTELHHIQDIVSKIALSYPEVAFQLYHQQKKILHWPAIHKEQWPERIAQVLGRSFTEQGVAFQGQAMGLEVWGWLVPPELALRSQERQYTFVNFRAVRDKVISHALKSAWIALGGKELPIDLVLFLKIDPERVDVNVHPTKHEVRFHEAGLVHDLIEAAVSECLQQEPQPSQIALPILNPPTPTERSALLPRTPSSKPLGSRVGHYFLLAKNQELWILELNKVARWWVQKSFNAGVWQEEQLLFPENYSLEEEVLDKLCSDEGLCFLERLKMKGRVMGRNQWVLEFFPDVLSGCKPEVFIEAMGAYVRKNEQLSAEACVLAWLPLIGAELFSHYSTEKVSEIIDHLSRLPLCEQRAFAMVLQEKHFETLFSLT